MANWAFPMVSKSGRIYVIYNAYQGVKGWIAFHTGTMAGIYSDDLGASWSAPQEIPMPDSPYDDPGCGIPPEWIVWQKPMRDLSGGYFVGYSHWLKPAAAYLKEVKDWTEIESVVEFMRFTNIDADPQPRDLAVRYSAPEHALRAPHRTHPLMSVLQEPSIVRLPDQRLFCVMRSCSGYIWWSQSRDDGETWCSARPLLYQDHGRPLLNPVSPDPIYPLSDGRYIILYHNNPGGTGAGGHNDATPREPLFLSVGEYRPAADQPVWFSEPRLLMATEGYDIDGVRRPSAPTHAPGICPCMPASRTVTGATCCGTRIRNTGCWASGSHRSCSPACMRRRRRRRPWRNAATFNRPGEHENMQDHNSGLLDVQSFDPVPEATLDLAPAKWLWYPGDRTLPNTFVLFRRVLNLAEKPSPCNRVDHRR